jgi:hypothetical protein
VIVVFAVHEAAGVAADVVHRGNDRVVPGRIAAADIGSPGSAASGGEATGATLQNTSTAIKDLTAVGSLLFAGKRKDLTCASAPFPCAASLHTTLATSDAFGSRRPIVTGAVQVFIDKAIAVVVFAVTHFQKVVIGGLDAGTFGITTRLPADTTADPFVVTLATFVGNTVTIVVFAIAIGFCGLVTGGSKALTLSASFCSTANAFGFSVVIAGAAFVYNTIAIVVFAITLFGGAVIDGFDTDTFGITATGCTDTFGLSVVIARATFVYDAITIVVLAIALFGSAVIDRLDADAFGVPFCGGADAFGFSVVIAGTTFVYDTITVVVLAIALFDGAVIGGFDADAFGITATGCADTFGFSVVIAGATFINDTIAIVVFAVTLFRRGLSSLCIADGAATIGLTNHLARVFTKTFADLASVAESFVIFVYFAITIVVFPVTEVRAGLDFADTGRPLAFEIAGLCPFFTGTNIRTTGLCLT